MTDKTWKVGPLAEASGLTVRTLHHWDAIGLLSPSRRTSAGHREYTEDDLVRLYEVLALRGLGLSLETITVCLETGIDPVRLVRDHLESVRSAIAALDVLRQRLQRIDEELSADRPPATGALLDTLRAIEGTNPDRDHVLRRHLDTDQLQTLAAGTAALGPTAYYLLQIEWPELYRRADRLRTSGVPAADPRVRRLADRMDELRGLVNGGDESLSDGVRAAWRDDPAAMSGDAAAPVDEYRALTDYLDESRRA